MIYIRIKMPKVGPDAFGSVIDELGMVMYRCSCGGLNVLRYYDVMAEINAPMFWCVECGKVVPKLGNIIPGSTKRGANSYKVNMHRNWG